MASMVDLFNIGRGKQQIQENEYDPYASATGSILKGVTGGLQERKERPMKEVELFIKLLEVAKTQGEMKRQQEIDQRNKEVHQQLFGTLNSNDDRNTTDKMGKPINTIGSRIGKLWETHDINVSQDSAGNYKTSMKPKKTTTTSTTKKEYTGFEKGESLREQVRKEQDSYLRATLDPELTDVPYEKKARWDKMTKEADRLQGIKPGQEQSEIESNIEKGNKGGNIGNFFKKGKRWIRKFRRDISPENDPLGYFNE